MICDSFKAEHLTSKTLTHHVSTPYAPNKLFHMIMFKETTTGLLTSNDLLICGSSAFKDAVTESV